MKLSEFKIGDKVIRPERKQDQFFEIYFKTDEAIAGINANGSLAWHYLRDGDDWELYVPEKKKVTKWLWAKPSGADFTSKFFTEPRTDFTVKLEWSATEFDED